MKNVLIYLIALVFITACGSSGSQLSSTNGSQSFSPNASSPPSSEPEGEPCDFDAGVWLVNYSKSRASTCVNGRTKWAGIAEFPRQILVSHSTAYVLSNYTISVIDTANFSRKATIDLLNYGNLSRLAASPDGQWLYGVISAQMAIFTINTATNTVVSRVVYPNAMRDLIVSPDGLRAYGSTTGQSVFVINLSSQQAIATINLNFKPYAITITPDGRYVYVGGLDAHSISVIDTQSLSVVTDILLGNVTGAVVAAIGAVVATPDSRFVYVASRHTGDIYKIDTGAQRVVMTFTAPGCSAPSDLAISADGRFVYADRSQGLSIIETDTDTMTQIWENLPGGTIGGGLTVEGGSPLY